METHRRGLDGRRIFTADFKREQIERVLRGSVTLSELSRELSVSPSVVRSWKHLAERGSASAIEANEEVVRARCPHEFVERSRSTNGRR
jgi:transposase-like protein